MLVSVPFSEVKVHKCFLLRGHFLESAPDLVKMLTWQTCRTNVSHFSTNRFREGFCCAQLYGLIKVCSEKQLINFAATFSECRLKLEGATLTADLLSQHVIKFEWKQHTSEITLKTACERVKGKNLGNMSSSPFFTIDHLQKPIRIFGNPSVSYKQQVDMQCFHQGHGMLDWKICVIFLETLANVVTTSTATTCKQTHICRLQFPKLLSLRSFKNPKKVQFVIVLAVELVQQENIEVR